jgi:integrase
MTAALSAWEVCGAADLAREAAGEGTARGGPSWQGSQCVFTTPIGPRSDYRQFRKLLARAGVPPVRLHDLRRTAASLLLAQGVHARVVMEVLGHSQIALTMNTCSHVAPEVSREAAARMAQALWQAADDDQTGGHGDGD